MSEGFKMVATVLGGLALFVYGMGLMSDGLKATAGEKMKAVLGYMTRNRLFAILAGAGVTALVQSSSATSVMTVASVALNSCLGKATIGAEAIEGAEREIDEMQREIKNYLIEVSQRRLTAREAQMIPELIHCVNDAERISDLALKVFRKTSRVKGSLGDSDVQRNMIRVASQVRAGLGRSRAKPLRFSPSSPAFATSRVTSATSPFGPPRSDDAVGMAWAGKLATCS